MKRLMFLTILAVFVIALALQAIPTQAYPVGAYSKIYEGIEFASGVATSPRLMRAWAFRVNLKNPDISLWTTPGNGALPFDTTQDGPDHFLGFYGLKIATNTCHWDINNNPPPYADVYGLYIQQGTLISSHPGGPWPGQMNFTSDKTPWFAYTYDIPQNCWFGFETGPSVLINGVVQPYAPEVNPYTGYGLTQDGKHMIMVCVDGRQPGWSDGCTYAELGQWLLDFGAWNGVHCDGGGSTCMVRADIGVVNRPCYGYVRQVATNTGFWSTVANYQGPASCSMNANRIDIVVRGNLNHIWLKTWTSAGGWATPVDLGGSTNADPAICSIADGRLDVFYCDSANMVRWKTWTSAGGWTNWSDLGISFSNVAASRRNSTTLDIAARCINGVVYHRSYNTSTGWSAYTSLGGNAMGNPAICSISDTRIDVFYCDATTCMVRQRTWISGSGWGNWADLGNAFSNVSAYRRSSTTLDLALRCVNGVTYQRTYNTSTGWSAYNNMTATASGVTICSPDSNNVKLFIRGTDDNLWYSYWNSATGWSVWSHAGNIYY